MNLLNWFNGASVDSVGMFPDAPSGMLWPVVTLALSALVVIGYGAIAIDWYIQSKLPGRAEPTAALTRLRRIFLFCALCSAVFYVIDVPWLIWRFYDAALLALVLYTWGFVLRMPAIHRVMLRLARFDELEKSAERYREIAELLPHMVWTATMEGQVDFTNRRWREYVGDNRTWLDAVHPEDRIAVLSRWNTAMALVQPLSLEARLGGSAGYRTFLVQATPLVHREGVKWLGACADIEAQRLLAAEKEAQARQKSFFLNALSHDLRAPLHNLQLNAHLLKMSSLNAEDLECASMIMENAMAAGDLLTRLLDFARVGAHDKTVLDVIPVEPVLHHILRMFTPAAEQKGLVLRIAAPEGDGAGEGGNGGDGIRVRTDRHKFERIISNLLDNAIKYTPRGEVSMALGFANGIVSVRVYDSGIGVPPASAAYLFDEFYQVNNHERDRSKGFGMGLAICKSLARHLGADVRLVSTGQRGSCFELTHPGVRVDRGGRSLSEAGHRPDSESAGVCRV